MEPDDGLGRGPIQGAGFSKLLAQKTARRPQLIIGFTYGRVRARGGEAVDIAGLTHGKPGRLLLKMAGRGCGVICNC